MFKTKIIVIKNQSYLSNFFNTMYSVQTWLQIAKSNYDQNLEDQ